VTNTDKRAEDTVAQLSMRPYIASVDKSVRRWKASQALTLRRTRSRL
jgi:hypothetical protein